MPANKPVRQLAWHAQRAHRSAGESHLVASMPVAQRLHARAAVRAVEVPHAVAVCRAGKVRSR